MVRAVGVEARTADERAQACAGLGREIPLIIGGQRVTTGAWRDALNPSRPKEIVARVAQADQQAADRAVQAAADAFRSWRRVPAHERAEGLFRLAQRMEQKRFELAALEALECGKPWREADADVSEAIDYCNYYGIYPSQYQTATRALPDSILSTYHLSVTSYIFNKVSNWIAGAVYRNSVSGSFLALGLTRSPDIRLTGLSLLCAYKPRLYRSEYTVNGTSRLVVLQLGQTGGV